MANAGAGFVVGRACGELPASAVELCLEHPVLIASDANTTTSILSITPLARVVPTIIFCPLTAALVQWYRLLV